MFMSIWTHNGTCRQYIDIFSPILSLVSLATLMELRSSMQACFCWVLACKTERNWSIFNVILIIYQDISQIILIFWQNFELFSLICYDSLLEHLGTSTVTCCFYMFKGEEVLDVVQETAACVILNSLTKMIS